jgi:hypothetical protein
MFWWFNFDHYMFAVFFFGKFFEVSGAILVRLKIFSVYSRS